MRATETAAFSDPLAGGVCGGGDDDARAETAAACTGGLEQPTAGWPVVINPG